MSFVASIWRLRRACTRKGLCLFFTVQTLLGLTFIHWHSEHSLQELVAALQRGSPLTDLQFHRLSALKLNSKEVSDDRNGTKEEGNEIRNTHLPARSSELKELSADARNEPKREDNIHEDVPPVGTAKEHSVKEVPVVSSPVEKLNVLFDNKQTFTLKDDNKEHFVSINADLTCYIEGTDMEKNNISLGAQSCVCKSGYFGADCGLPDAIWNSPYGLENNHGNLKRRKIPRRVINGMPLLNEVFMLESRVNELAGAVDLFLLAESNYSSHGDPKKLYIKEKLENGFLKEFHKQILHVFVGFFPNEGKSDSWFADRYLRIYMGKLGIPRILGVREDDLFILNDADEVPSREVVMFLKLYEGYTEPVALAYRWSVYGFFFKNLAPPTALTQLLRTRKELTTTVSAVATMGLVTNVLENDPFMIRTKLKQTKAKLLGAYTRQHPGQFNHWTAGGVGHYSGWHCSWCFVPEGIVLKLDSAQAGDRPRWGDYPEKHERRYLEGLIRDGRWFDGSTNTKLVPPDEGFYAPPYMLRYARRFQSILFHPTQRTLFPNSTSYVDALLKNSET